MPMFILYDTTNPGLDPKDGWNDAKEAQSRKHSDSLMDCFNAIAKAEGVEDKIQAAVGSIGLGTPKIVVYTDDETVQKITNASQGRLAIAKITLH